MTNEKASMKVVEDDSHKEINVQGFMDFALIRWRNNQVFKLLTKTMFKLVSHTIEI